VDEKWTFEIWQSAAVEYEKELFCCALCGILAKHCRQVSGRRIPGSQ
jgi:hypothetical protein